MKYYEYIDPPLNQTNMNWFRTDIEQYIYLPSPKYYENTEIISDVYIKYINDLLRCPMSPYQYSEYRKLITQKLIVKSRSGSRSADETEVNIYEKQHYRRDLYGKRYRKSKKGLNIDLSGRQASLIIYPRTTSLKSTDIQYGNNAFKSIFEETKNTANKEIKERHYKYYKIKHDVMDKQFMDKDKLYIYSSKYYSLVNNLLNTRGIGFIFSNFLDVGALTIALILEYNGYLKYSKTNNEIEKNLLYQQDKLRNSNRIYKCALCPYYKDDHNEYSDHKFRQAYYVLFTGLKIDTQMTHEIEVINNKDNKNGELIKLIIGTSVASEGLDYKRIREIHIMDPWHNATRIHQVIGRGLRHCSHVDLPPEDRNILIFKYSATPTLNINKDSNADENTMITFLMDNDDTYNLSIRDMLIETSDEKVYQRVEEKDVFIKKVELLLIKNSIDCELTKELNNSGINQDLDVNTRKCYYQPICNYTCFKQIDENKDTDVYTYHSYFYEPKINYIKQLIYILFQNIHAISLSEIYDYIYLIDPTIDKSLINEALDKIVGDNELFQGEDVIDRFGRVGNIITKIYDGEEREEEREEERSEERAEDFSEELDGGGKENEKETYFIFQPKDLKDTRAPLYYKRTPLTDKINFINLISYKQELKHKKIKIFNEEELMEEYKDLLNMIIGNKLYKHEMIEYKVDRYNKINLSSLCKFIFKKMYYISNENIMDTCNGLSVYIYNYLTRYGVMKLLSGEDEDNLYLYMRLETPDRIIKLNIPVFNTIPENISDSNNEWEEETNIQNIEQINDAFNESIISQDNVSGYYGKIEYLKTMNNIVFKLVEKQHNIDKPKLTLPVSIDVQQRISKRNIFNGRVCKSYAIATIKEILEKIERNSKVLYGMEADIDIGQQGPQIMRDRKLNINKDNLCSQIELYLRYLNNNELKKDSQLKWFVNNLWKIPDEESKTSIGSALSVTS